VQVARSGTSKTVANPDVVWALDRWDGVRCLPTNQGGEGAAISGVEVVGWLSREVQGGKSPVDDQMQL